MMAIKVELIETDGNDKPIFKEVSKNRDKSNKLKESLEENNDSFNKYSKLYKISKCSKLLQEIYDCICESDSKMCYIDEFDWKEDYSERFTEKDIEHLKVEVKKYHLEDVISFTEKDYVILGYSDLEKFFYDDRNIRKEKSYER